MDPSPIWFASFFRLLWRNTVRRHYEMGVINSERALQACVVNALMPCSPEIVTLVEPTLAGLPAVIPDLWVGCPASNSTLAVIELKYVPHAFPNWEKDLTNLARILDTEPVNAYGADPRTGRNSEKMRMTCGPKTLGVYAAIGRHDAWAVSSDLRQKVAATDTVREGLRSRILHASGVPNGDTPKFEVDWLSPDLQSELASRHP